MTLLALLLSAGLASAQSALPSTGQVLLPELTPAAVSDMSLAILLYDTFLKELNAEGLRVINADQIAAQTPDLATACADTPECPLGLLAYYSAPVVLVVRVARSGDNLILSVDYYGSGGNKAIASIQETVPPGQEYAFAHRTAVQAREILAMVAPISGRDLEPRVGPVEKPPIEKPPVEKPPVEKAPVEKPPVEKPPVEKPPVEKPPFVKDPNPPPLVIDANPPGKSELGGLMSQEQARIERRKLGVTDKGYTRFLNSGMSVEDWARQNRLHTGKVSLELQGGTGGGGLSQLYEVVYLVDHDGTTYNFDETAGDNRATQQMLVDAGGRSPGGFAAFGVSVSSRVEVQILGGVWRSQQLLYRGWVVDSDVYNVVGPEWEQTDADGQPVAETPEDGAIAGLIETRARVYARGTGVIKPYGLGGLSFLVLSGYDIGDKQMAGEDGAVSAWSYDDPGGLNVPGLVGGAGLMIDPTWGLGFFGEGVYTWNIPVATSTSHPEEGALANAQGSYDVAGSSWRVVGGLQVRF